MDLFDLVQPEHMQSFLQDILGAAIRVNHVEVAKQLPDYLVVLVSLRAPGQRLVVKAAGREAQRASQFERTAALHPLVARRTSIPMPEVLAADTSLETYPWRYLVTSHLPGASFAQARLGMSEIEIGNAFSQLGKAVGELHAIHFPAFGELDANLEVQFESRLYAALQRRAGIIIQKPAHRDLFLETLQKNRGWFPDQGCASLVHEDLHAYNLLFHHDHNGWQLATVLDFDKAWAGSPESDLARLEFWRGMMHPQFWQAYRAISALQDGYEERRAIYQLLWCLEYAETTQQHLEDTQKVCRQLSIPGISSF